jgi:hypothetical protein
LTLKNSRALPLIMVIKSTELFDPEAYGLVFIVPTKFFYLLSDATTLIFDLEKQ